MKEGRDLTLQWYQHGPFLDMGNPFETLKLSGSEGKTKGVHPGTTHNLGQDTAYSIGLKASSIYVLQRCSCASQYCAFFI